jgi:hypothetical protein
MPCITSADRTFRAVIKDVHFSWGFQWLCATVSNLRRNTAQDAVPSNTGGCAVLALTPSPLPRSALATTNSNRLWNSRWVASISEWVVSGVIEPDGC